MILNNFERLRQKFSPYTAPAQSGADRKAAYLSRRNEIGDIAPVRHARLREACKFDLEKFGRFYCRRLLDHRASSEIKSRLIDKMQQVILSGGQLAVEFTRSAGKTTWTEIAFVWALLYGHRRFPVCIAASRSLAKSIFNTVVEIISNTPEIASDFPAVPAAMRAIGGVVQRAASITYRGASIEFDSGDLRIRFPMLRDEFGTPLEPCCGANFACRGVGASVRGLNELGSRPDLLLFDDPQTQKDASSPSSIERLDKYIHGDALNLAANTTSMAAFLTITPQKFGDLAHRIADKNIHPNWSVSVCPFLISTSENFENLANEFIDAYNEDAANDDFNRTASRDWYLAHQKDFVNTITVDPQAFDKSSEYDSIHHALVKMAQIGKESFAAEYQMQVSSGDSAIVISPQIVANALSGYPRLTLPPGTTSLVGFCDVNIQRGTGLTYGIAAFGRGRIASVIAYGRYPSQGTLVPAGASDLQRKRAVAAGIRAVVAIVSSMDFRLAGSRKKVSLKALGFDRGYLPDAVCRTLHVLRHRFALPFQLCAVRGFGWQNFGSGRKDIASRGDHVFVTRSDYGEYLAVHTPYWREIAQSGFSAPPLTPGSCTLYGDDAKAHYDFANETCAERLIRKYIHPSGKLAWDWSPAMGANHYGDVLTNLFAMASWFRIYDALPQVIDQSATSAPLFSPTENPQLNQSQTIAQTQSPVASNLKKLIKPQLRARVARRAKIAWRKK